MPSRLACPDVKQLQQLVLGRLSDPIAARLEQHVEECQQCGRLLPTLAADDALVASMRAQSRLTLQPSDRNTIRGLIPRLQRLRSEGSGLHPLPPGNHTQGETPPMNTKRNKTVISLRPGVGEGEVGRLGKYRILEVLGQGGMGVVFRAEDVQLKRIVALKAMLPEVVNRPTAKERFLREAEATANLEHDNIVSVYDVGEDNGVPYMAMQLLKGMSLDDFLKKKQGKTGVPLSAEQVLKLGREIAKGLAAAHENGLIHRDIKPANIWLDASAGGRAKILDFGLARAAEGDSKLTQVGTVVGTPAFMAPEQAKGGKVDGRADLFSLGCVLYRLCTGHMPFKGRDAMELLISVATDQPKPAHELNPNLPPKLSRLVMKLLEKKPEDRPASARNVVDLIQLIERDQPTMSMSQVDVAPVEVAAAVAVVPSAHASTWQERTGATQIVPAHTPYQRRSSRSPLLAPAILVVLLLVAAGVAVFVIQKNSDPDGTPVAQAATHTSGKGKDTATPRAKESKDGRAREVLTTRPTEPKENRPKEPEPEPEPKSKEPEPKPKEPEPKPKEPEPKPKEPEPKPKEPDAANYITNSIGMKFVPLKPGEFLMGMNAKDVERVKRDPATYNYAPTYGPDQNETPQHKVRLTKPFWMGAHLVTQAEYEKVMRTNPSTYKDSPEHPVDNVPWSDAVAFCKKLTDLPEEKRKGRVYRLPTEAEWEYACRAGTTTLTAYGDTLSSRQANCDGEHPIGKIEKGPKVGHTTKVGSYPPNAWGLFDMHGNLWQWCLDGPRVYTNHAATDPKGPDLSAFGTKGEMMAVRVLRGGAWREGAVSASMRKPRPADGPNGGYRGGHVGFRVVCVH
jgi:serine/threonine protein kinase